MKLRELLQELRDDGFTQVWLFCTYGATDHDGNPSLLDLLLDESGEEIARRHNWSEQGESVWSKHCCPAVKYEALPAGAAEFNLRLAFARLAIGSDAEPVLDAAVKSANRRPY